MEAPGVCVVQTLIFLICDDPSHNLESKEFDAKNSIFINK